MYTEYQYGEKVVLVYIKNEFNDIGVYPSPLLRTNY